MINQESKARVIEFLKSHPSPSVIVTSTIMDGFASCIKPIKAICGAEIYCAKDAHSDVMQLIKEIQQ